MIQRIQSLYLLISFGLILSLFFIPFAELINETGESFLFLYRGLETEGKMVFVVYPVAILTAIIALVNLVTIFLYKRRMLQIRLTVFNMICMLGLVGLVFYSIHNQEQALNAVVGYSIVNAFPLVAFVFNFMAMRAIRKDENLIRSMDRIR